MKKIYNLNGEWKLYYDENHGENIKSPEQLSALPSISASVPGNVEINLSNAGIINKDLYKGMATKENEKFETYDWWYETHFCAPVRLSENGRLTLSFDGVDCFADYYLNNKLIASSENALVRIDIDITNDVIWNSSNTLHVHIRSAFLEALKKDYPQTQIQHHTPFTSAIRKSAHSFGWDIFPRAVSAGIWKDAKLISDDGIVIKEFSYQIMSADEYSAKVCVRSVIDTPYKELLKDVKIRMSAICAESSFEEEYSLNHFIAGWHEFIIKKPKLW